MKTIVFGFMVLLLGIWGGAFLCSIFPLRESDYALAAFFTGILVACMGIGILVYAMVKWLNGER